MHIALEPFVAIFLATQLRKTVKADSMRFDLQAPDPRKTELAKYMMVAVYGAVALVCVDFTARNNSFFEHLGLWLGHLLVFSLAALPYYIEDFKPNRTIVTAMIPYIAIAFISDLLENVFPTFYDNHQDLIENIYWCTILWFGAMYLITRKQSKALETERKKRFDEQEQNRMMAAMKVNLESEVKQRTAQLTHQTEELQQAISELKSTQAQLIQSEKMASLGELTAGIAHEIQNPLNFVNNFSEVSIELLDELKEEILSKLPDDVKEEAGDIINDITQNLTKINQHGKRADAIVKGMLQHSRTTTGKKEPTDVNALADEYLRLSYHGLRAKDKLFNAGMKTSFDANIGKINAIPQDLGRVLLNLFNNSFYSVAEKKKLNINGYEPTVTVVTKKVAGPTGAGSVEITVSDNGMGIPQKVLDKIYQPFFTTKPTGQGTGLGLSMSYDIITKAHGGELKVETAEGEFARFIITIPNLSNS
ncbi:His Kinase A (phospho-acceptor) domain-containing protein [Mucilaginibacter pineti]|uniref:histidine kinase n=1 Tax=Mucilaginibacter pineti TaxID=1391627 RepID=A0A1G6XYY1_9SPHI|nr:ATP-binding protein [Mucilaginibacter pineti]SDD83231.1 His Kinase A (phospho-acceptor) domain-containing protein [Mucilaginibacter pineti]